ncbi:MAG: type 4a pilus biogenesis protein PilO [Methylococcaceae bacterium]|nr:type 4a pilus biogenesis protein PilO [Methylococcaceae bacterium]
MNLSEVNWELDAAGNWPLPVKLGTIFIVCAIAVGLWIKLDTLDQLDALELVEKKEIELKGTFELKQKKAINLDAYKDQLKEIEETFGTMLRQLPDKTEVANLLVDVSQTGLASGLEFELFKPQEELKQDFYAELPINIRVIGAYDEFGTFVSGLASLPRIVTIHNVNIKPQKDGADLMKMEAMVKTYRYLDESEKAVAASEQKKRRAKR